MLFLRLQLELCPVKEISVLLLKSNCPWTAHVLNRGFFLLFCIHVIANAIERTSPHTCPDTVVVFALMQSEYWRWRAGACQCKGIQRRRADREPDCSLLSILRKLFMWMNNVISVGTQLWSAASSLDFFFFPPSALSFSPHLNSSSLSFQFSLYRSVTTKGCKDVFCNACLFTISTVDPSVVDTWSVLKMWQTWSPTDASLYWFYIEYC